MDNETIVCFCHKVNYGTILESINNGAKTVDEIVEKTSAGSACGGCKTKIKKIIAGEL